MGRSQLLQQQLPAAPASRWCSEVAIMSPTTKHGPQRHYILIIFCESCEKRARCVSGGYRHLM